MLAFTNQHPIIIIILLINRVFNKWPLAFIDKHRFLNLRCMLPELKTKKKKKQNLQRDTQNKVQAWYLWQ